MVWFYLIKQIAWGFNFEMSSGGVVAVVACLEPPTPLFSSSVCERISPFFFSFFFFSEVKFRFSIKVLTFTFPPQFRGKSFIYVKQLL